MTDQTARLLRDAESYLSALHGSVARHDNLAANFGCAGCELRDKIAAELRAASSAVSAPATGQWNGEPCTARRVTVTVANNDAFPMYWARAFVGMRRKAVEVGYGGETFYLDDEDGSGWNKVTMHGGSPWFSHSGLTIEPGSVEPRDDRDDLRERIAEALIEWAYRGKNPEHGGILETVRANAYSRADAVLSVLPAPTDQTAVTPPPALTEEGRLRAQVEVLLQDAERDRGLAKVGARCMRKGHQGLIEQGRAVIEGHRFALSVKLDLGTGAPWDAIYERVAELRRLAGEAQQDETQDGTALAAENEALWDELHRRDTETDQPHPVARPGQPETDEELAQARARIAELEREMDARARAQRADGSHDTEAGRRVPQVEEPPVCNCTWAGLEPRDCPVHPTASPESGSTEVAQ